MENSEIVWCSSNYVRYDFKSKDSGKSDQIHKSESLLEVEYNIATALDLKTVPISGTQQNFIEQHLWQISSTDELSLTYSEPTERIKFLTQDVTENTTIFYNNWGKLGRTFWIIYIMCLSMIQDISGVIIPNPVYKQELTGSNINVVTNIPCTSILYPFYWKYILTPIRLFFAIILKYLWNSHLSITDVKPINKFFSPMTWFPRSLYFIDTAHLSIGTGINIYISPFRRLISRTTDLRYCPEIWRIINKGSNRRIICISTRPIGYIIALGYSDGFSIWEHKPSFTGSSHDGSFISNGSWKCIFSITLYSLKCLVWSNDGRTLYVGDGSCIRAFSYIYMATINSIEQEMSIDNFSLYGNGQIIFKAPTFVHDCLAITTSDIFSILGIVWDDGYINFVDTNTCNYLVVKHISKFKLKRVFLPIITCVDDLSSNQSCIFLFSDSNYMYEFLIKQDISQLQSNSSENMKDISSNSSEFTRLRALPIHSSNREKKILSFTSSYQRVAIIYENSNLVWLYSYTIKYNTNSHLLLIGTIEGYGIPRQINMQIIPHSVKSIKGSMLVIKWISHNDYSEDNIAYNYKIKSYPLFYNM
ncbi:hypothetical protein ACR3K2_15450 [Cryptosporidium serpentis]